MRFVAAWCVCVRSRVAWSMSLPLCCFTAAVLLLHRARLMKRNGFDEEQADKRVASQPMTNEERAARATLVISNEGTEEQLAEKV